MLIYGFRKFLCHDKEKKPVKTDSKDYDIKNKKTKGALKKNLIAIRQMNSKELKRLISII
jgi:hypothetical protein